MAKENVVAVQLAYPALQRTEREIKQKIKSIAEHKLHIKTIKWMGSKELTTLIQAAMLLQSN